MSQSTVTLIITFITAIAAFITALATIFVPIITANIAKNNALRLRSIDLFFSAKVAAYKQFIEVTANLVFNENNLSAKDPDKLQIIAHQACLFADSSTSTAIIKCTKLILLHIENTDCLEKMLHAHAVATTLMKNEIQSYHFPEK